MSQKKNYILGSMGYANLKKCHNKKELHRNKAQYIPDVTNEFH